MRPPPQSPSSGALPPVLSMSGQSKLLVGWIFTFGPRSVESAGASISDWPPASRCSMAEVVRSKKLASDCYNAALH